MKGYCSTVRRLLQSTTSLGKLFRSNAPKQGMHANLPWNECQLRMLHTSGPDAIISYHHCLQFVYLVFHAEDMVTYMEVLCKTGGI